MPKPIDLIPGFAPKRTVQKDGNDYIVTVQAPDFMGEPPRSVRLRMDQYARYCLWRNGGLMIQDALPELSASAREILMSGLGDEHFKKEEGEEDGD